MDSVEFNALEKRLGRTVEDALIELMNVTSADGKVMCVDTRPTFDAFMTLLNNTREAILRSEKRLAEAK